MKIQPGTKIKFPVRYHLANESGGLFGVGSKGTASKQFLPAKYNRQSELRVEIIADRNAETHDFALTNSE